MPAAEFCAGRARCAHAGVTVYVSDFKRSIVDKLAKDFFSEPSQVRDADVSIAARVAAPL